MRKIAVLWIIALLWGSGVLAQTPEPSSLKPLDPRPGAFTLYTLSFTAPDTVPPDGVLHLNFPQAFSLAQVSLAGSSTMNGGFAVEVNGRELRIRRGGEGQPVPQGTAVDVKFSLVKNPAAEGDYSVTWLLEDAAGNALAGPFTVSVSITKK